MKKKKLIILIVAAATSLTVAASIVVGTYFKDVSLESFENLSEERLIDKLTSLRDDNLMNICKEAFDKFGESSPEALIPFASELAVRINNFDEDYITSIICDKTLNLGLRSTILQCYAGMFENKTDEAPKK